MKRLILISGVSGAGKTTATNLLEDMGYCCIDGYPIELIDDLLKLIREDNSGKYENVALAVPIGDLLRFDPLLNMEEIETMLVLLDAKKDTIIQRYKFTRRIHPMLTSNVADTISEAVDIEKKMVSSFLGKRNVHLIDTTELTIKQHQEKLRRIIDDNDNGSLSLSFVSFGYKYGVPEDADLVFDVRFLKNPFYVPELKEKTGNDPEVAEYVLSNEDSRNFLEILISYLDFCIHSYDNGEKRHLTICIGCTGGQHRSVSVTNHLYGHYASLYNCFLKHRELER